MTVAPVHEPDASRRWFVIGLVVGWALIGVGVWSALRNDIDANPVALVAIVIGFDLVHDLLLAPLLIGGAWLIARLLPAPARGPVRAAGAVTVLVTLFSFPLLARLGRRPTNSSTVPLDYGRNVVILLTLVWIAAAVAAAVRIARARRP